MNILVDEVTTSLQLKAIIDSHSVAAVFSAIGKTGGFLGQPKQRQFSLALFLAHFILCQMMGPALPLKFITR